jgi:hypothetical protein
LAKITLLRKEIEATIPLHPARDSIQCKAALKNRVQTHSSDDLTINFVQYLDPGFKSAMAR